VLSAGAESSIDHRSDWKDLPSSAAESSDRARGVYLSGGLDAIGIRISPDSQLGPRPTDTTTTGTTLSRPLPRRRIAEAQERLARSRITGKESTGKGSDSLYDSQSPTSRISFIVLQVGLGARCDELLTFPVRLGRKEWIAGKLFCFACCRSAALESSRPTCRPSTRSRSREPWRKRNAAPYIQMRTCLSLSNAIRYNSNGCLPHTNLSNRILSSLISMTFSKKPQHSHGALPVAITGSSDTAYLPVEGDPSQANALASKGATGDGSDICQLAETLDPKQGPNSSGTVEDSNPYEYSTGSDKASAITIVWVGAMMYPPKPKIGPSKAKADTSSAFSCQSARGTMSSFT
jgi:hypothetical protein